MEPRPLLEQRGTAASPGSRRPDASCSVEMNGPAMDDIRADLGRVNREVAPTQPRRLMVVRTLPTEHDRTRDWILDGLTHLGHAVDVVDRPGMSADEVTALGYRLADDMSGRPDAIVCLGWVAGLVATVVTRAPDLSGIPCLLRMPRPGRSGIRSVSRVEAALARSGATLVAAGPREVAELVDLGARRGTIRVVLEAVDVAAAERHAGTGSMPAVVTALDDTAEDVTRVLTAMATGRAVVAVGRGILSDLVADQVTGVVVTSSADVAPAARTLAADPMGRETMGMAALDRVAACLSTEVVVPRLGRALDEAVATRTAACSTA